MDSQTRTINKLQLFITGKRTDVYLLDNELETKRERLAYIEKLITEYIEDLRVSRLIIEFIVSPNKLIVEDFDELFKLIISLSKQRKIIEYRRGLYDERTAYAQIMPALNTRFDGYFHTLQETREKLACYLAH